ncbi:uncharacterized protein unm_hu7910 isoform X21 [Mustelus asterias]
MTSKNKAGNSRFNSSGPRKDKHSSSKNGKKSDGPSGSSFFTWFMIIALLGVWSSVAVVWFDLVDYKDVLAKAKEFRYNFSEVLQGKLGAYDADGDGDFDVEDAKILLGLKDGGGPVPAEDFGKKEEPIQPSVHTFVETEADKEEIQSTPSSVTQESLKPIPEEVRHDAVESEPEEADIQGESEYVEDERVSESTEILEDSGPEVADVSEDKIPESETREEELDDVVSDEAELEPEEVVSERDDPGLYESYLEEDFSDQVDFEDEIAEELPMSDEFIEAEINDPEPEDTVESFYAEETEYVPGAEDIQDATPVLQNTDEDSESDAVPLPEAVGEPNEEEDDTREIAEEHLAEDESVNYAEVSEPSEPDHLEVTDEPKEEVDVAEPEAEVGVADLEEEASNETVSLSENKLKETPSDL